jgi:FtsZ-interacting cell division protein ZipA
MTLRWILLALGVLFIAALAWWEWRRPRRIEDKPAEPIARAPREPLLILPEIRPPDRDADLPVLEVVVDSLDGLTAEVAPDGGDLEPPRPQTIPVAHPAPELTEAGEPLVAWPPENERRIVALRLVAHPNERFAGRNVRQALAAEGFVSGKLSIFHKAAADGRALVSAASLSKPGTFDPELMDSQRFIGLNLFAVLPGPLPPREAFDELLSSARNLNQRLAGTLQDVSGEPLTQTRAAALREELPA